jgi:DNA-binding response OmpR family regulator
MAARILVIEDDEHILELVTEVLWSAGYQVTSLRYPDLALDVVHREQPDLILIDVMLPKKSGVEVADCLWLHGFGTTPMIAMSASNVMYDLAGHSPFFHTVVRKPFDMESLLRAVRDAITAHHPLPVVSASEHARMSMP